jgi:uncharacterized repeat protein (TIGR03803 family)
MNSLRMSLVISCCVGIAGCAQGMSGLPTAQSAPSSSHVRVAARGIPAPAPSASPAIYTFAGQPDGGNPWSGLVDAGGTLYGTTSVGGANNLGAVFSVTPSGVENVIYSFAGSDGQYPFGSLIDVNGTLYGTTVDGGQYGRGEVFSVTTSGTEHVVYSFQGTPDGQAPYANLLDYNGALYGTTSQGGAQGYGTVFKLPISGKNAGKVKVMHSFKGGSDGATPKCALVHFDKAFYGTTTAQGSGGAGTVFKVTSSGIETPLHEFAGAPYDGSGPVGGLVANGNALYGTTEYGGSKNSSGIIFKMTGSGRLTVTHNFGANGDGVGPVAAMIDVSGTLYGTTNATAGNVGCGTVFSITPSGSESVVFNFCNGGPSTPAGSPSTPEAGVIDVGGMLYGTTLNDTGPYGGEGTVFAVSI